MYRSDHRSLSMLLGRGLLCLIVGFLVGMLFYLAIGASIVDAYVSGFSVAALVAVDRTVTIGVLPARQ